MAQPEHEVQDKLFNLYSHDEDLENIIIYPYSPLIRLSPLIVTRSALLMDNVGPAQNAATTPVWNTTPVSLHNMLTF